MSIKQGEVSWGEDTGTTKQWNGGTGGKDTFLRLEKGKNNVRVITNPFQYVVHYYKPNVDPAKATKTDKYGHRIMCSRAHGECPVCKAGDKPQLKYLCGLIDRKTGTYKILDFSTQIFKGIKVYNDDPDWGPPQNYDLDIVVDPSGGPSGYYKVVAKPAKALTANDQLIIDSLDLDELRRRATAPEPVKVKEKFDAILKGLTLVGNNAMSSSEDTAEFPDADHQQTSAAPF